MEAQHAYQRTFRSSWEDRAHYRRQRRVGQVMASALAQAGAHVAALGRREERALAVAATIRATGGKAIGVAATSSGKIWIVGF